MSPKSQPQLPGFRIDSELGAGGFARVWRGYRDHDGETAAIKVAHGKSSFISARFEGEALAMAAIGPPHVPELYQHGVLDDGRPYLIMECLEGQPLTDHLASGECALDFDWIGALCDSVLANLAAAHKLGIAHLDLKPDNIFVMAGQPLRTKLMDFGLCQTECPADHDKPFENIALGSVEYMAPEQIGGHADTAAAADIYSFGVLLYQLLTRRVPFRGDRDAIAQAHLTLRPAPLTSLAAVPAQLEELCLACLKKKPEARPPDATALRPQLARVWRQTRGLGNAAPVALPAPDPVKLLAGERQPVALLIAEGRLSSNAVLTLVERHKGFVARHDGQRYVCAFSSRHSEIPLHDALAAARELRKHQGARVTLHIDDVKLRPGRNGRPPKIYGAAVEHPQSWLPSAPWSEIYLTAKAAAALAEPTVPSPDDPDFRVLAPEHGLTTTHAALNVVPLVGREGLLERARASLNTCLTSASPRMLTLIGDHGLGKSRMCRELSCLVDDLAPHAKVMVVRSKKTTAGAPEPTWTSLIQGLHDDMSGDTLTGIVAQHDVRVSIRALGDELRRQAAMRPMVLIIDDIQYAANPVLDALEYAALDGDNISLWIVAAGLPRFLRRRPNWGAHVHAHEQIELTALAQADAMELAVALLRPAEYPPPVALQQLAEWTGGNPYLLTALVNNLKRAGVVRQGRQPGSWYMATEELSRLPALPVGQWLAEREIGRLSPSLAACVRVCAVLGSEFLRDELAWVQDAADLARTATTTMDIDIGLDQLRRRGILVEAWGGGWAFREILFQVDIYELIARDDREHIHRSALEFWRARAQSRMQSRAQSFDAERALAAMARHSEAIGDGRTAASVFAELARRARAEHRYVDADNHYSRALALAGSDDTPGLIAALRGRGTVRYRLQRIHESIEDLRRARQYAEDLGENTIVVELHIEEATALDWAGKYDESAAMVARARALVKDARDHIPGHVTAPGLRGRCLMAWGRSLYREGRIDEAVRVLGEAHALVMAHHDHDTAIVVLLLLGPLLVQQEQLDRARNCFDEVISLCVRASDRFHLCVAHLNRAWLWLARRSLPGAMDDLRRAQQLARELGQPILERGAAHNLAEFLHWSGDHAGACAPARRAFDLQRFLPDPVATDVLLLGRVLAACEQFDEVRSLVAHARGLMPMDEPDKPGHDKLALHMLEIILADAAGEPSAQAWDALIKTSSACLPVEEFLEVYYFRARLAARGQRWDELAKILDSVAETLGKCPLWSAAFAALAARKPLPGTMD